MPELDAPSQRRPITYWLGWVLTLLPVFALCMSGVMKILLPPDAVKGMETLGWPIGVMKWLAIAEFASAILYLIPQTAGLGAILATGYLGGAIAAHVRVGDGFAPPVILGVMIWLGLFLRDPQFRALFPFRNVSHMN
ncbi:DoxX family protein [Planctomicrobium sp. SH668]|uniref:DoxX family protein n=1 Tax=Planctomicrobium sp. SH668 TaxID=3448126 RepID=UPI003F5C1DE0